MSFLTESFYRYQDSTIEKKRYVTLSDLRSCNQKESERIERARYESRQNRDEWIRVYDHWRPKLRHWFMDAANSRE